MVRTLTLTADDAKEINRPVTMTRDEPYRIIVDNKPDTPLVMTIASGAGDEPLVELPGQGQINLSSEVTRVLEEGRTYQYNIWQTAGPMLLFAGTLTINNSIAPTGVSFATAFLSGFGAAGNVRSVVHLSQDEYDRLVDVDSETLYVVEG